MKKLLGSWGGIRAILIGASLVCGAAVASESPGPDNGTKSDSSLGAPPDYGLLIDGNPNPQSQGQPVGNGAARAAPPESTGGNGTVVRRGGTSPTQAPTPPPPPPPPPPGLGAAEAAAAAAQINSMNNSSSYNQTESEKLVTSVHKLSRQQTTQLGTMQCAKGFLEMLLNPVIGGLLLDACGHTMHTADMMHDLEIRSDGYAGKMTAQDFKLDTQGSKVTSAGDEEGVFSDLNAKYDVSRGDFENSVAKNKGDAEKIGGEVFGDKIPKGSVARALDAAAKLSDEARLKLMAERNIVDAASSEAAATAAAEAEAAAATAKAKEAENVYNFGGPRAKAAAMKDGMKDGLRDRLKQSLAERALEAQQRSIASRAKNNIAPVIGNEKLEPLKDELFEEADRENSQELSLFDVVHSKYATKFQWLEKSR